MANLKMAMLRYIKKTFLELHGSADKQNETSPLGPARTCGLLFD
jgi:hypothetical protein